MSTMWQRLLFFVVVACELLLAQPKASLTGRVTDPQGAAVAHAKVSVASLSSGVVKKTTSDQAGEYKFLDLDPGIYRLSAEAPGFVTTNQQVELDGRNAEVRNLRFVAVSSHQQVTVIATTPDILSPDPAERVFTTANLLAANPGRPGTPVSIPGLPAETASGGIKAPQYFAPGVAGDHGEPIAQFLQIGDFLLPNNLPANAHGNGYADPNLLIPNTIETAQVDAGAFDTREGNNAVDLGVTYGFRARLLPFLQFNGDSHDLDLVTGWSPRNPNTAGWIPGDIVRERFSPKARASAAIQTEWLSRFQNRPARDHVVWRRVLRGVVHSRIDPDGRGGARRHHRPSPARQNRKHAPCRCRYLAPE